MGWRVFCNGSKWNDKGCDCMTCYLRREEIRSDSTTNYREEERRDKEIADSERSALNKMYYKR